MTAESVKTEAVAFEAAAGWAVDDLAGLWNRAYHGYLVPIAFTPEQMGAHVRRSKIDLAESVVGRSDGTPFGLCLAARRGTEAWIGGFGVAPEYRRRGLAGRLIEAQADRLDALGVDRTRLEVIEQNPAREVYRAAGFRETRSLSCFEGVPRAPDADTAFLFPAELAAAHARLHREPPPWRRRMPFLRALMDEGVGQAVGVRREGVVTGFAVVVRWASGAGLADMAVEAERDARAILGWLARTWPGERIRLIDEPEDTPAARALQDAGFGAFLRQVEMERTQ